MDHRYAELSNTERSLAFSRSQCCRDRHGRYRLRYCRAPVCRRYLRKCSLIRKHYTFELTTAIEQPVCTERSVIRRYAELRVCDVFDRRTHEKIGKRRDPGTPNIKAG